MDWKKNLIYGMFGLFVILHLFDLIITFYGINKFGFWIEQNNLVRELFVKGLSFIWIIIKIVVLSFIFFLLRFVLSIGKEPIKNKKCNLIYNLFLFILSVTLFYVLIKIFITCLNWIKFLI